MHAARPSYDRYVNVDSVKRLAHECGFELAGVAPAEPIEPDWDRYQAWIQRGFAGEMRYLTDRRADVRHDPRHLLPSARSVICVGKLYHQKHTTSTTPGHPTISQYAWGRDYHDVLRESLEKLARKLHEVEPHEWKVCVDTAPLLERSYARQAGLGWIGKNTCLIHEPLGSWFFLGEIVTSLVLERDSPPPDRCGTCTRCIEACPTRAIVPADPDLRYGEWTIDARRCISYLNIELRGPIPEDLRADMGSNVFGCDICQDVCPWNSQAPATTDPALQPVYDSQPTYADLVALSPEEFRARFRGTPVTRPKYEGFLRSVAVAMGASAMHSDQPETFRGPLEILTEHPSELVAEHARWALQSLTRSI
jgi:epoxyqueuosine reductase